MLNGWRARIGFIYPSSGRRDYEYNELMPPGVTAHFTRVEYDGSGAARSIMNMSETDKLVRAAALLATIGLDAVSWADTSGSFLFGIEYARQQLAGLSAAANAPASSTSIALLAACEELGVQSLSVASPYLREVNEGLLRFLEATDITVADFGELGLPTEHDVSFLAPERMRRLARQIGTKGDALFIPCTDVPALELVSELERDLGKPVFTSNQVTAWHALKLAGVQPTHPSGGRLFRPRLSERDLDARSDHPSKEGAIEKAEAGQARR